MLANATLLAFDTARAWLASPETALAWIEQVEGEAGVDAARQAGRPVVFLLPHLGNWELINHYLGTRYALTHMYQPDRRPQLDRFVRERRSRTGTRFVPTDRAGIRAQLDTLRSGGCIGTMADQEPGVHEGVFAPLFGLPAWTGSLASGLANRTDAAVFVAWCERTRSGRFAVRFLAHDDAQPTPASFNNLIEQAIRQAPAQYLWTYKRFRTCPPGSPAFYPAPRVLFASLRVELARAGCSLARAIPPTWLRAAAHLSGRLLWLLNSRFRRQSLVNVRQCLGEAQQHVAFTSWLRTTESVAASVQAWRTDLGYNDDCRTIGTAITDAAAPDRAGSRGTLILAPRLGQRELLLRAAAGALPCSEIYQPFPRPTIDALVRERRTAWGIRLLTYTNAGFDDALARLRAGQCVIVCPEQQPRLADGLFVSFFGVPALMATDIARLIAEAKPGVLLAWAEPTQSSVNTHTERLSLAADTDGILRGINAALERMILASPTHFRWHDKRFNIRPRGARRLY